MNRRSFLGSILAAAAAPAIVRADSLMRIVPSDATFAEIFQRTFDECAAVSGGSTLDDYEEGTWEPTLVMADGVLVPAYSYVKVGNLIRFTSRPITAKRISIEFGP